MDPEGDIPRVKHGGASTDVICRLGIHQRRLLPPDPSVMHRLDRSRESFLTDAPPAIPVQAAGLPQSARASS